MGRDIYFEIRDRKTGRALLDSAERYQDYVCGRDDATGYVAMMGGKDGEIALRDKGKYASLRSELAEYAGKDAKEIERVRDRKRNLLSAQRNARNYEEFVSFDDEIESAGDWLEHESWSRAKTLVRMLDRYWNMCHDLIHHPILTARGVLYVIISE